MMTRRHQLYRVPPHHACALPLSGMGQGLHMGSVSDGHLLFPGDKRFECAQCQKRFMRSDHLTKHYKTHLVTKNL